MYLNSMEGDTIKKNQRKSCESSICHCLISLQPGRWEKEWTKCFSIIKQKSLPRYQILWQDITLFRCRKKNTLNKKCGSSGLYKLKRNLKNSFLNKRRSTVHMNFKNTQVEVKQKQEDIFRHKCWNCFPLKITLQKFL